MKKSKKDVKSKVILDTSCYVASLLSTDGASAQIVKLIVTGEIFNFYTDEILEEVKGVLGRPKFNLEKEKQQHFIHIMQETSFQVDQLEDFKTYHCRDPKDDKFLSLASQIGANYIITFDEDLLVLNEVGKTKILRPQEFLKKLRKN